MAHIDVLARFAAYLTCFPRFARPTPNRAIPWLFRGSRLLLLLLLLYLIAILKRSKLMDNFTNLALLLRLICL